MIRLRQIKKHRRGSMVIIEPRQVKGTQFSGAVRSWLLNPAQDIVPPTVIAAVRVSKRGEIFLRFKDREIVIWGWPLYRDLRGKTALLSPQQGRLGKELLIADQSGKVRLRRLYDPRHDAFFAQGHLQRKLVRIYTELLPPTRIIHALGIEFLFSKRWKPGRHIQIWWDGQVRAIGTWLQSPRCEKFRSVLRDDNIRQIIVGRTLPRELLTRVCGTVPDIPVRIYGGSPRFNFESPGCPFHYLTPQDAQALGLKNGDHLSVTAENGWPLLVENRQGVRVYFRILRTVTGRVLYSARRKIAALPPLTALIAVERVRIVRLSPNRGMIQIGQKRYILATGAGLEAAMDIAVIIRNLRLLCYLSSQPTLNIHERELGCRALSLFSKAERGKGARPYADAHKFMTWVWESFKENRLVAVGVVCTLLTLRAEFAELWNNPPDQSRSLSAASGLEFRLALDAHLTELGTRQPPFSIQGRRYRGRRSHGSTKRDKQKRNSRLL